MIHEKIKYDCPECPKSFSTKGNRLIHVNSIHKGLKNICCEFCDKKFTQLHNLKLHMKSKHKTEQEVKSIQNAVVIKIVKEK